jgi:hypothetical protein
MTPQERAERAKFVRWVRESTAWYAYCHATEGKAVCDRLAAIAGDRELTNLDAFSVDEVIEIHELAAKLYAAQHRISPGACEGCGDCVRQVQP